MTTLKELSNAVDKVDTADKQPIPDSSLKGRVMSCLNPPYVYFIILFFVVVAGLYYTKPCYVVTTDPKTNQTKIDYKSLLMYSIVISGLVGLAMRPYVMKK